MRGRKLTFIIGCLLTYFSLSAQPFTQTIKGTVSDTDTQTPLVGATVFIPTLAIGTTTDIDGKFLLDDIPLGRYDIVTSYLGYLASTSPNVIVRSGKEVVLNINLIESVNELKEVIVKASKNKSESLNQLATISSRQFTLDEARRYAGSRGEPSRMAQNYAGVSGSSDSRNDIIIRGNSPLGLLWRFEGLDIPNPNHFALAGSTGGTTSILNTNVLSNSDFLTGAFPAGYGNATSGVFDIRMRNGNSDTREYMFSAGVLGIEAMLEGGFSEKSNSSYLVNYRYSTTQILTDIVNIDIGFSGKPTYQDAAFKVKLPTQKAGIFTLFGLGGWSKYVVKATERDSSNFDIQFTDNANYDFTATMGVVGLSHKFILKKNAYLNTTIGLTGRTEDSLVDSVSTTDANIVLPFQRNINRFWNWQAHSFLNKKFSPKFLTRLGIIYNRQSFSIDERIRDPQSFDLIPFREGKGNAGLLQAYSAWQLRTKDNSSFNFGLHYQYFDLNQTQSLEWRFGAKIPVSDYRPKTYLTVGAGVHGQIQLLPLYFVNTPTSTGFEQTNLNLDFTKSRHLIIGLDHNFSSNLRLKTEAYLQDLTQVPIHKKEEPSTYSVLNEGGDFLINYEDNLVNEGEARNYGIELTLEKFYSKSFYFLLTTSFFKSQYKASSGGTFPTKFDTGYIGNLLAGKEFSVSENKKIIIDLKATLAGGRRYTPIDLEASNALGQAVFIPDQTFALQHRPYFRTDFKITFRLDRPKISHEVFLNVDNVFNINNIFATYYNPLAQDVVTINQLGIFPIFQYRVEF